MEEFESLLKTWQGALERFVYFKISIREDAEDVLQDTYITAYRNFESLRDKEAFRAWIFTIAANKCKNYYAALARRMELPIRFDEDRNRYTYYAEKWQDRLETEGCDSGPEIRYEINPLVDSVHETLAKLKSRDKQMLYLYFFRELPQADIAKILGIPLGTVKSRLHNAKEHFKSLYTSNTLANVPVKGTVQDEQLIKNSYFVCDERKKTMILWTEFPAYIPEYKIEKMDEEPFAVRWEEMLGWFLVPRQGEKTAFAIYDRPNGKCDWFTKMEVIGEAVVHGISGVDIMCTSWDYDRYQAVKEEKIRAGGNPSVDDIISEIPISGPVRNLVAQLTDTHCRYLASTENLNGVKQYTTFLDGDGFLENWGFGDNNCGKEVNISPKGEVVRDGNTISFAEKEHLMDVVGRYQVTVGGKVYDTVCVMNIEASSNGTVTEQFIDENGRTVLWRIFCQDNWRFSHYNKLWTEMLPDSERLNVNGMTYVQWYDCITDYVLK